MSPSTIDLKYLDYLTDLGLLLKESALEARAQQRKKNNDFYAGYLNGFIRVISLMQQQAESFDIPLSAIHLDDVDPYDDLLS